jgi:hypothetical protein
MDFLALIGLIVFTLFVLMIVGFAKLFSKDELKRKKGAKLLLGSIVLFLALILIGYSICSNIHIGGH